MGYGVWLEIPFDAEAGVTHKAMAGEVVRELDLGAYIEVWAVEPSSDIVPQLGFGDHDKRLAVGGVLSPYIEESGETQSGSGTEVVASPDKSELERHFIVQSVAVVGIGDVLVEQLEVEDILIVRRMEAIVETREGGVRYMVSHGAFGVRIDAESAVVLHLNAQVLSSCRLPEIEAACYLGIGHKRRLVPVLFVDRKIEVHKSEGRAPWIGIEQLERSSDTVDTLVLAGRALATEVVVELQVGACARRKRAQA